MTKVNRACSAAPFGKLMPTALYVHGSALQRLAPILRVYEGCARVLSGVIEGTTIVKLRRAEPKVSYLRYPAFDTDGHPMLAGSVRVDLRSFHIKYREFADSGNPPILHRKELFVPEDYPNRAEFAELTRTEVQLGLLDAGLDIGLHQAWEQLLQRRGLKIVGHGVVHR